MKRRWMVIAGIVLTLCLIAAGIFALTAYNAERQLTEQLELGRKYLEEMNYEQAIVAFEAAIAIDPKCEEAYLALADVYLAQGTGDFGVYLSEEDIYVTGENVEKAMEVLEEGYSQTSSETILIRLEELRECYQAGERNDVSIAENGQGAAGQEPGSGQEPESSQASGSGEVGSQSRPSVDSDELFVQFVNAPFTDENGFGDVTSLDAAVAYAEKKGLVVDTEEDWEVWTPVGDLYLCYGGDAYSQSYNEKENMGETFLRLSTTDKMVGTGNSFTQYTYSRYEEYPLCVICTYIANVDTITGKSVPPVGGFAGFLAEYDCLTLESTLEAIGLNDEELMAAVLADDIITYEDRVETPCGTANVYFSNYTAFVGETLNRSLEISFLADSSVSGMQISLEEGVTYSSFGNGVSHYFEVRSLSVNSTGF